MYPKYVIATANMAGSAGKTTSVVTIATELALAGLKVWVIDADAQANASTFLGIDTPQWSTGDVLQKRVSILEALIPTAIPGLFLLAATDNLDADGVEVQRFMDGPQRLRKAIENVPDEELPDVIIIDCSGAVGLVTIAALIAATAILSVTQPTLKEISGLQKLENTIGEVNDAYPTDPPRALIGIIPCIVPGAGSGLLYIQSLELLTSGYGDLVTPSVRRSVRIPEAYSYQTPLPIHAPNEEPTKDYRKVVTHLRAQKALP